MERLRPQRARLGTLAVGLALGAAAGLYIHRWWGHGMFQLSTILSVLAVLLIGLTGVAAIVEGLRGHAGHAGLGVTLTLGLTGGALAGAALGPGYSPAANYEGTVRVHVTAPTIADWAGTGFCWTDANSTEVGGIWIGSWTGPGRPTEGSFGFTETGAPAFHFGTEGDGYDLLRSPRARVEMREVTTGRLAGEVAFIGMPPVERGLLDAFPGVSLDGTVRWSCDPSRPVR